MRNLAPIALLAMSIIAGIAGADTLFVPDDFEAIQQAIAAAENGDAIFVAEGRYEANLDFLGKALFVRGSPDDPAATVIDGREADCVVKFVRNERDNSILDGFTLTNGAARGNGGGGVYCQGSMPILRNLVITGNRANRGGGLLCWDASPRIDNVVITENEAQSYGGGVAMTEAASPIFINAQIIHNVAATNNGGGVASFSRGRPEIHQSIIRGNRAANNGGGLFSSGRFILNGVTVDSNIAEAAGGGIYANGDITVAVCEVIANRAADAGAIFLNGVRPSFDRVVIARNVADGVGGGLYLDGEAAGRCDPILFRTTIADNGSTDGGGIFCRANSNPQLNSSIFWGNDPQQVLFSADGDASSAVVLYSDVQDGEDGIETNDNGEVDWGRGNLNADPLFADPGAADYHITWVNYPEEDETRSPCIDAAHPNVERDPDDTRADMGAHYFPQLRPDILVRPDEWEFGPVPVGERDTAYFTILNVGFIPLHIREVNIIPENAPFTILEEIGEDDLAPDSILDVTVVFAPPEEAIYQALLHISSNDPDEGEVSVRLRGSGGNGAPIIVNPIADVDAVEDADSVFVVDMDSVFVDPDGDRLVYQIPRWDPNLDIRVARGSLVSFRPAADFWVEDLAAVIRAVDEAFNITVDTFLINIHPTNDPPSPFALISPPNGIELGSWTADFIWEPALQNRWETDTVRYTVEFFAGEAVYSVAGLTHARLDSVQMEELAGRLGLTIGNGPVQVGWRVFARDDSVEISADEPFTFIIPTSSVSGPPPATPQMVLLSPNFPNPFNGTTTIRFGTPTAGRARVEVLDLQGRKVALVWEGRVEGGWRDISWNAGTIAAGLYLMSLRTDDAVRVRLIQLIR